MTIIQKASLNPNYLVPPPPVLSDAKVVYDRILALGSLLRTLDPSLPPNLRFYRRTAADEQARNDVAFKACFTDGKNRSGMPVGDEPDFWEAAERVLPPHALHGERKAIEAAPAYNFKSAIDAAVYGSHRAQKLAVNTQVLQGEDQVIQSTTAVSVPELDYKSEPSLARWVYLSEHAPVDDFPRDAPGLVSWRRAVQQLRQVLSQSYEDVGAVDRQNAEQAFKTLENGREKFEFTHQNGWIGFALAHGGKGWTKTLLNWGANPTVPYNGVSPTTWAVAADDANAILELDKVDVSMSTLLVATPQVFDEESQRKTDRRFNSFSTLLSFASVIGATKAAGALLRAGADPNQTDIQGETPLMAAAKAGDEATCRVLIHHGANLEAQNADNLIASELVPVGSDGLFDWLENLRLNAKKAEVATPGVQAAATPNEENVADGIRFQTDNLFNPISSNRSRLGR